MTKVLELADRFSRSHADTDALACMTIALGDVIAIESLAAIDQNLVIPATGAARSAYEIAVTCAWMLAPDGMSDRDLRWEALFYEEREFWSRAVDDARRFGAVPGVIETLSSEVMRLDAIIEEIQPQVEAMGARPLKRLPTFDERLKELGQGALYVAYKNACQLVHPTTRALRQVRDLEKSHSEGSPPATYRFRTRPLDWTVALFLGAESLRLGIDTLGTRLLPARPLSPDVANLFNDVVAKIGVIQSAARHADE